jgi:hypothetical protein
LGFPPFVVFAKILKASEHSDNLAAWDNPSSGPIHDYPTQPDGLFIIQLKSERMNQMQAESGVRK